MAISQDVVRRITVEAQMRGLDQLARQLDAAAGGMDHLAQSSQPVVAATEKASKSIEATGARLEKVRRQTDPILRDLSPLQSRLRVIEQATTQGLYNDDPERRVRDLNNVMMASRTVTKAIEEQAKAETQAQQIRNYQRGPADAHVASYEAIQKEIEAQKQLQNIMRQANPPTAHVEDFRAFQAQVAAAQKLRDVMRQANPPVAHVEEFRAIQAQVAEAEKLRNVMRQANPPDLHVQQYREQQAAVAAAAAEHEEYAKQAHAVRAAVDPVAVAEEKHNAALKTFETLARTVNPATKEMYLSQTQLTRAVAESTREFENAKRNAGADHLANGLKLASYQATNLGYQLNDVLSGIAMGQSPLTILSQQGGQVYQILADIGGGGGVLAGAGAAWQKFTGLFTAGRVAIGGTVGVVAGLTYEMVKQYNAGKTFEQSLAGVGKASGATAEGLMAASNQVSKFGDISITSAQGIINSFAKTGKIAQEQMIALGNMTKDFAYTAGLGLSDAGDELGKAMSSLGTGGIEELEKRVGSFTIAQHDMIEALARGGNEARAQSVAMQALRDRIADASASLSPLGKMWDEFWKNVSKGASLVGQAANTLVAPSPAQQLSTRQRMGTAAGATPGEFDFGFGSRVEEDPGILIEEMRQKAIKDTAKTRAEVQKQAEDSVKASKIVDGVYQEGTAYRKLTADIKVVNNVLDENAKRHNLLLGDRLNATEDTAASLEIQRKALLAGAPANDPTQARVNRAREDIANQTSVIKALGGEQIKAAVTQQTLTEARRQGLTVVEQQVAVEKALAPITAQQNVAERNRTLQHNANMQSIEAFTQAEVEAAAGQQAYTAALISGATGAQANKASTQAMAEARAQDVAASRQITRAHEANMQAIVALTTEEKANAAASVAAAGQRQGSMAASTAATAAYAEEVTRAAVVQRDFDRNLAASQGNARREAVAQLQAAQLPIGPGRQRVAGQIEAEAQARSQVASIQAQNPNIQIDTSAFVRAAQDVAALGEAARQSDTALQMVASWSTQAANLNVATAKLTGGMDAASAAAQTVINSGMAQINAAGLEGSARDRAIGGLNEVAGAAARNAEAADLVSRNHQALARDAEMAAQGISEMGVSLKNIVHDTTISAADANGKTIGSGVTLTGLITPQTALMLTQLHTSEAVRDAYQRRSGANDNSAAMAIASPVASLVDNAQSQLQSARDQVKSAEEQVKSAQESAKQNAKQQAMANATKSEPQLDPYLSRNASVYYGVATESFYKEVSWQDASLNMAKESLSTDQEALDTAQKELSTAQAAYSTAQAQFNQLQSIASSANSMAAAGMSPTTIGNSVAAALAAAGYAKTAQDVTTATQSYTTQATQAALTQRVEQQKSALSGTPYYPSVTSSSFNTRTTPTPFTPLADVALLKPHATGADLVLPGSGGEQPYVVSAQPGERLRISPSGSGDGVTINDNSTTQVFGVSDPNDVASRLMDKEKRRRGYSAAAVRAAGLAA